MISQILMGSLGLGISTLLHIAVLIGAIFAIRWVDNRVDDKREFTKPGLVIAVALSAIVFAHTIQVWLWAVAFIAIGALPTMADAIYFSIITYTTVGYGDLTVGPDARIFGAMAAVTGLLNFGLSTAFLVSLVTRLWPNHTA